MLAEIARRIPNVAFHVYGDVNDVKDPGALPDNLILKGHIRSENVYAALSNMSFFLNPAQRGMVTSGGQHDISGYHSPLKIFEAMAVGVPIVTSDFPNLREILSDEEAIFVAPDDVDAWVAAVLYVLQNLATVAEMGLRAQRRLEGSFTWEHRCERFIGAAGEDEQWS